MNPDQFIGKKIGSFRLLKIIGEGAYSIVCLAEETVTIGNNSKNNAKNQLNESKKKNMRRNPILKRYVACKIVPTTKIEEKKFSKRLSQEIQIHKLMHHPNVVQLIDIQKDPSFYYIFLEFVPCGELFQMVLKKKNRKLTEKEASVFFKQILIGLQYIHSLNVAHRDLKPQNILVDQFGRIKICDFGLSKIFDDSTNLTKTPCGSPCYVAPEIVSGFPYDAKKSDIWSCGVILYAITTGYLPWTEREKPKIYEQILNGDFSVPSGVSDCCSDLIYKLMAIDLNQRISIEDALKHPFLKDVSVPDAKIGMNFEPVMKIDFDEQKEIKTNFFNDDKQKDLEEDEVGQSTEEEIKINNKNFNNIKISHRCASPRAIENPFYTINKI